MTKISHIFRFFVPYGIVRRYQQRQIKKKHSESSSYIQINEYLNHISDPHAKHLTEEKPNHIVVSVHGMGYSGSGAVSDLLREYSSTAVIANMDNESLANRKNISPEVNFMRATGGLLEVELFLKTRNQSYQDALLHRMWLQLKYSELFQTSKECRLLFYDFFSEIAESFNEHNVRQATNWYLHYENLNALFRLRNMSLEEYRAKSRKFMTAVLNRVNKDNRPFLVLDQFLNNGEYDFQQFEQYIPNNKIIFVCRDPRDVYAFAIKTNVLFIPHNNVDDFISWYKYKNLSFVLKDSPYFLLVRFEDLINDYQTTVNKIEDYIGLKPEQHTSPRSAFSEKVSKKNVGIHKQMPEIAQDCQKILQELGDFCYTNKMK